MADETKDPAVVPVLRVKGSAIQYKETAGQWVEFTLLSCGGFQVYATNESVVKVTPGVLCQIAHEMEQMLK